MPYEIVDHSQGGNAAREPRKLVTKVFAQFVRPDEVRSVTLEEGLGLGLIVGQNQFKPRRAADLRSQRVNLLAAADDEDFHHAIPLRAILAHTRGLHQTPS